MNPVAHILVHGYLGAPTDLAALADALARDSHAGDRTESLGLPGHGTGDTPAFDADALLAAIAKAIDRQRAAGRDLVLVGHSTGGSLILTELARRVQDDPASLNAIRLLVLCATPPRIDTAYARRWNTHLADAGQHHEPTLDDLGGLVSLVNRLARRPPLNAPMPVLIVHGEADELVPVADAEAWLDGRFAAPVRLVRIPDGRHPLFSGAGAALAIDTIARAVADARHAPAAAAAVDALVDLVPGLAPYVASWPAHLHHLLDAPAGRRVLRQPFTPQAVATAEPTLVNIEITTRCTLACTACARTQRKLPSRFMSRDDFRRVLEALPHAWRVVLVGLGEPLLHPEVVEFVRLAVAAGRRVSLVTNAMPLDAELARALCTSGLAAIPFSLDAMDPALAARVRQGSDMERIRANIRGLLAEKARHGVPLGTAVFTALTGETIGELEAIVDFAADCGIDALMVSDLNFPANQPRSVRQALTPEHARRLRQTFRRAAARHLPVLSVLGLEEYALERCHLDYLLLNDAVLAQRSPRRTHCLSPWQTIPVSVDGTLSFCDCQPGTVVGHIGQPLSEWWNGPAMVAQRCRMLSDNPPHDCLACPRF